MARQHARIVQYPFAAALQGALLDSYEEQQRDGQLQITLKLRALERKSSELFERDGEIHERIEGVYYPMQLHFSSASELQSSDFFKSLNSLHPDDPLRTIEDMLSWRRPDRQDTFYLFGLQAAHLDNLMFFAKHIRDDSLSPEPTPFILERDWSPAPPMSDRLVPRPKRLHQRFGGDPITLRVGTRPAHHRLFVGGLDIQPGERPQVDVIFNVSEEASKWVKDRRIHPRDRWDNKGEGSEGMSLEVIREEAEWVIERLRKNQRVLVHCVAGMNRSSTICCAALILLEGLTADQALDRVREHHPWARPDSRHWLKLRWLAKTNKP